MLFRELEVVHLKEATPELPKGTVGTIVHVYRMKPEYCELEVKEKGVFTVPVDILEEGIA